MMVQDRSTFAMLVDSTNAFQITAKLQLMHQFFHFGKRANIVILGMDEPQGHFLLLSQPSDTVTMDNGTVRETLLQGFPLSVCFSQITFKSSLKNLDKINESCELVNPHSRTGSICLVTNGSMGSRS